MRTRMAATLALLTSTALAGAAFAGSTTFETTESSWTPKAEIQLAQADPAATDPVAIDEDTRSAADQGQAGVRVPGDAEQPEDLQAEPGINTPTDQGQPGGMATAPENPDAASPDQMDAGPDSPTFAGDQGQPGERVTGEEAEATEAAAMDEPRDYRSYSASPEAGGAVLPEGYSAEDFLDRRIVNAEGEEIGEVVDLMIDENNNITKVVADVGGFLGMGENRVAIDRENLTIQEDTGDLVIGMSRMELELLPTYELEGDVWTPARS